jgi:peptidoglycan/xylan/chitin deacetylase (PgdA/CDA1 family)
VRTIPVLDSHEAYVLKIGHTWSHASLIKLNDTQIDAEIQRLDEAFVKILGVKPKHFRCVLNMYHIPLIGYLLTFLHIYSPPYGDIDERTASYVQSKYGKTIVLWDLDSGDTASGADEQGSIDFYKRLAAEGPNSKHLPLSHETHDYSVHAAENYTVDALYNAGVTLLTVAQCLDMYPYEFVGPYGVRDSTWTCDGTWTPPPC